jgi:shikimate dehydrogenase
MPPLQPAHVATSGDEPMPSPIAIGRLVLLGHPVAHSLSPRFQNAALLAAGIPLRYAALDVAPSELAHVLDALVESRSAGNVTIPHKAAVAERCDLRSALAARVGAVNTFWCTLDGRLCGDNTDVPGFAAAARALLGDPVAAGLEVALIGAGGSAAAVLAAAERWPAARVRIWSRRHERASDLADRFPTVAVAVEDRARALDSATLIVNATPLGLRDDDPLPVEISALPPYAAVLDLVYRPGETAWVRAARRVGHRAADGLPMLVEQGVEAFARWFGVSPDREVVWAAVGGRPPAPAETRA